MSKNNLSLFVVTFPHTRQFSNDMTPEEALAESRRSVDESFVSAVDIPDAFHRFTSAFPSFESPVAVRRAGPVAEGVMRRMTSARSLVL